MDQKKKALIEAHGWTVGTVEEFLGLSPEEAAYVEAQIEAQRCGSRVSEEEALDSGSTRQVT